MTPEVWALFVNLGPTGLVIGYLIWDKTRSDDANRQQGRERTEADKALAAALAALTVTIQHFTSRVEK